MSFAASLVVVIQLQGTAPPPLPDTSLFPPRGDVLRLYTDCDEERWPYETAEVFVPKTLEELVAGVARRQALEARWREYFSARSGDSRAPATAGAWAYPLPVRGRLLDNYLNPRDDGPHQALDIFVTREGVEVRSPVAGVVIAAGDGWDGGWRRRGGLFYRGGGLSRRAGNGVIIFDPASSGYLYLVHLQPGLRVRAGDVVRKGQTLGRVGHSGNASQPGHGRHLHLAFKQAGTACGVDGVLVSRNPYREVRAARDREHPRRPAR
jgi:murein DD-endopeptidase MepM/ murein hydrolase activator NlpD